MDFGRVAALLDFVGHKLRRRMDVPELVVKKIPETDVSAILNPIHFAQPHRRP